MTDNFDILKQLISSQVPEFIRTDHETFIAFLEAYYEWLELPDNAHYYILLQQDNIDIDKTLDEFIDHFKTKYMDIIPSDIIADPKLVLKYVKDFYSAKGTEKSYRFLFRILYDKDIEFFYPKEYILKVSDGKWVKEIFLFTKKIDPYDPFLFQQTELVGLESGSTAIIDAVQLSNEGPYDIYKFIVNEFEGEFNIGETVQATLENGDIVQAEVCGYVSDIEVTNSGLEYEVGDFVPIIDETGNGVNAIGQISEVFDPKTISSIDIIDGGSGYQVGDPVIFDESNTQGFGAIAKVSSVSPDEIIQVDNTIIGDHQNRVLNSFYTPLGQNINDIVIEDFLNFINITRGSILDIEIIDGGQNYNVLPSATVGQKQPTLGVEAGTGAVLQPRADNEGAISKIKVVNNGVGYIDHPVYPIADLTELGDGAATANVNVAGGPLITDGRWLNYDGRLDSIMVLQDGDYWQLYSYVIKVDQSLNDYKKAVKEIVHPAGMKLFGQVDININLDTTAVSVGAELTDNRTLYTIDIHPIVQVGAKYHEPQDRHIVVKPSKPILLQSPVFIFNFENEIIDGYDEIVLEDFVGFTQQKNHHTREALVDIIV